MIFGFFGCAGALAAKPAITVKVSSARNMCGSLVSVDEAIVGAETTVVNRLGTVAVYAN